MHQAHLQQALPLPQDDFFSNSAEDPQQICKTLKLRILSFIADIEHLLEHPHLASDPTFLDKMASHLVTLQSLISSTSVCCTSTKEISQLLENMLRCTIAVQDQEFALSMLDAAKIYRKNKKNLAPLSMILKSYPLCKESASTLVSELKVLASDLIEEKENI